RHDHQVRLPRRRAESTSAEAVHVVTARASGHHFNCTASQAERHRPDARLPAPVNRLLQSRRNDALFQATFNPRLNSNVLTHDCGSNVQQLCPSRRQSLSRTLVPSNSENIIRSIEQTVRSFSAKSGYRQAVARNRCSSRVRSTSNGICLWRNMSARESNFSSVEEPRIWLAYNAASRPLIRCKRPRRTSGSLISRTSCQSVIARSAKLEPARRRPFSVSP